MSKQLQSSYKTIAAVAEGVYRENGSKFIAFAIPVQVEDEIKEKLLVIRKILRRKAPLLCLYT